ncbi:FAD-binding oxidoreductase [Mesonia sp. MT50]|uniref:FAD-binding oxidoreductase n=1 Tax=Mesonia profundi TaxID=3070998 RepID=A0ABU1A1Z1_9FLAO|nr:FAD-binding oxidoreductase [Mesonia profundi]MDQ7917635.1 FAD-binding oxidoreductase [Mesonia profundi]
MKQVKILSKKNATHDVVQLRTQKPKDLSFLPGQAVDVSLNKPEWKEELRPFTFTSLPQDDYLEFHIKIYPEHDGVTEQIGKLRQNDSLSLGDVFGAIKYQGEGVFIAGGAGVTPFISILRDLEKQNKMGHNKLLFANKTADDIIEKELFNQLLGDNFVNVLSDEQKEGYEHGYITKDLIKAQIQNENSLFYLCGPPPMMDAVLKQLKELGIDKSKIIQEEF